MKLRILIAILSLTPGLAQAMGKAQFQHYVGEYQLQELIEQPADYDTGNYCQEKLRIRHIHPGEGYEEEESLQLNGVSDQSWSRSMSISLRNTSEKHISDYGLGVNKRQVQTRADEKLLEQVDQTKHRAGWSPLMGWKLENLKTTRIQRFEETGEIIISIFTQESEDYLRLLACRYKKID